MIGIGIDTGGTCTDAAAFDQDTGQVLAWAKAQTTRRDLKAGILEALRGIPAEIRERAEYAALSTTLATNACVEGKGGRAGLVLIGAYPKVVERLGPSHGLPPMEQLCLLPGRAGEPWQADEAAFRAELRKKCAGCGAVAVVQMDPDRDGGALERQAARVVGEELGVPCVLGYALFQEKNVLRRGASALLNARLQPVMEEFLEAIRRALRELGMEVPVMIVRSDGTLMSRAFAAERPVETLLCGPAASVIGGQALAREEDALIVDMGGTTTDVSLVRGGFPLPADEGLQVGGWKTMVRGVNVSTFALGGDTRVLWSERGYGLDGRRCIPLCTLASRHGSRVTEILREIAERPRPHAQPIYEFLVLVRPPLASADWSERERRLCRALEPGPLPLEEAAQAAGCSLYDLPAKRLEAEGLLLRSGVTPTDAMHACGDYTAFDREAALLGLACLGRMGGLTAEEMAQRVNGLVVERLYRGLARILLERQKGLPEGLKTPGAMDGLTQWCYEAACRGEARPFLGVELTTRAALVGVGAPTHLYLPRAAELLGTRAVTPRYASTANALGAAVSCVSAEVELKLTPRTLWDGPARYELTGGGAPQTFDHYETAVAAARRLAGELAVREARRRGALGELRVETETEEQRVDAYGSPLLVGAVIRGRATAGSVLAKTEQEL